MHSARLLPNFCPKRIFAGPLLRRDDSGTPDGCSNSDRRRPLLVVVVRIEQYLAEASPDPARSFFGARIGPRLTAAKELRALATRGDVIKIVVKLGLTIEDVAYWATLSEGRYEQLSALTRRDPAEAEQGV